MARNIDAHSADRVAAYAADPRLLQRHRPTQCTDSFERPRCENRKAKLDMNMSSSSETFMSQGAFMRVLRVFVSYPDGN